MELEFALHGVVTDHAYRFPLRPSEAEGGPLIADWQPALEEALEDVSDGLPVGVISARFHNGLVEAIVAVAERIGQARIALSGGCFQNKYLTERAVQRLTQAGFEVYRHRHIPPNDNGIALGQIMAASRVLSQEKE